MTSTQRRAASRLMAATITTVAIVATALTGAAPASAASYVPGQFVVKQYVEALGRVPDSGGFQTYSNLIAQGGCDAAHLRQVGTTLFTSGEFTNKPYDSAARVLALYRAALNREPDQTGLDSYRQQLDNGSLSWGSAVASLYNSGEFSTYASAACNSADGSQYFGTQVAANLPVTGTGFNGSESDLQALLDSTPSGGTVALAQKAVVRITSTLSIPNNVTLTTTGTPDPSNFALLGRLVRDTRFGAPMVRVQTQGHVDHVWIDGARGNPNNYDYGSTNVEMWGGSGNSVTYSRMGNTSGWTNLQALGSFEYVNGGKGAPCSGTTLSHNVIDAFSSSHNGQHWSDGLSVACENATIEYNQIADATDVGIVLFRSSPAVQQSQVRYNTIINSGNPAFGGIVADPLSGVDATPSYVGAAIYSNTLWTAASSFMHIGISVGTRPWYSPGGTIGGNIGHGVSVTGNDSGGLSINATIGISVSGMTDVTVTGNTFAVNLGQHGNCPQAAVAASVSAGLASGTIQPYTDTLVQGCI